jgi:20S proteasome subunit alpha 6
LYSYPTYTPPNEFLAVQETGPHLFEFSPSGVTYEYFALAIGARSQSAKTYLEKHYEEFPDCEDEYLSIFFRI